MSAQDEKPGIETKVDIGPDDTSSEKIEVRRGEAADQANLIDTQLTIRQAFIYYRKAIFWALAISMATIMESYMMMLTNSFYAQPQFQKKFGEQLENGSYSIPARWQVSVSMAGLVGLIFGVFANGFASDKWGLRKIMITCHFSLLAIIFSLFFAPGIEVILVGTLLLNVPCGFFAAAVPTYVAEVTPLKLRGYMTVYVNLCWVMGKLVSFGVIAGTLDIQSDWSWRLPYAIQWVWPLPLAIACFFAPESPWWLARQGRFEDAKKSLDRLVVAPVDVIDTNNTLSMIQRTIEDERRNAQMQGSYLDCFKGTNLRRTEIAMVSWGCQILPGFVIQNYITYFFTLAGLSTADSFYMSIGNAGIAFLGTVSSWAVMTRFGWRTIYLSGLIVMIPLMGTVGFLDLGMNGSNAETLRWVQAAMLLMWFFTYGISIGPIPYGIAANVPSATLRNKTVSLGRNNYYFLSIINTIISPYFLNPTELNLKGKTAFLPWGLTMIMIAWTFFRLPELKGLTQETLNHLFENRTPTRKFIEASKRYQ